MGCLIFIGLIFSQKLKENYRWTESGISENSANYIPMENYKISQ